MIKVLNIISDTNIGGAGRVIINYLKYYNKSEFEIAVCMPKGSMLKERIEPFNVPIFEIEAMADKSMDIDAIKKLKAVIREYDPDIVHTHGSMSGRIAGRQCGKKVIFTRHSAFPVPNRLKKGVGRFVNKKLNEHYADRIIAVSPAAAENLTDGGISPELIDIMMNGVDPVKRADADTCRGLKAKYNISDDDFTVGIVARIEDYKGHMDILRAVCTLINEGRKIKLIVAGVGGYENEVKAEAERLGISDSVIFTGFLNDVSAVLSILDLQLNASWGTETSSLSILEGFSMGLPAVVSDYGGNPCLVDDGVNGYIFKKQNSADLADKIRALMDSREVLSKMRVGALDIYKTRFTGEIFAENVENVYKKTLRGI